MLLGGHCQPEDEITVPKALSIMMGLQLSVYLVILVEHYRGYGAKLEDLHSHSES